MVKQDSQATVHGIPPLPAGLPDDAAHQTANALHSAAVRLLRRARTADIGMDLDGARASALSVLVFAGPVPVGRLAAMEQVSAPAMTKTVTLLEAAGLAERTRLPGDRRVVVARATTNGRAVLERGRAARVRLLAGLLADLSDHERRTLDRAAQLLMARLGGRFQPGVERAG